MRDQLLEPLSNGAAARYQRYDWELDQLREWLEVPATGVVLVDGVYTFRPELREYYGYSIFVDTPKQDCLTRLKERGDSADLICRWRASEDYYQTHFEPARHVSVVMSGADN